MKEIVAEQLLTIRAVFLQPNDPFTWSSGIKSPIYCDNRLTLSYPEVRQTIADGLAQLIKENYHDVEVIAGTATAGIPHAAFISDRLNIPMCYVRSKAKEHGKGKQIEGLVQPGQKVVVVEDLISTGGSAITAVKALREAGAEVLGVVSIFTYNLPIGNENFQKNEIKSVSLCNFETLVKVAIQKGYIEESDKEKLNLWVQNPSDESWINN
ncbi:MULTISPECIES: orotate phosphoribosyltransferase [Bacillus]|uniref:orotate phosphoribosyltransferase n=1 Tax=Bacillus TaxID=1386 RepID=UPI000BB72720|nr:MULTISPECIES: orotate phosphoribosyltransferase [Bacillus]